MKKLITSYQFVSSICVGILVVVVEHLFGVPPFSSNWWILAFSIIGARSLGLNGL